VFFDHYYIYFSPPTFADDTAVLAINNNPATASSKLQSNLLAMQNWLIKWKVKVNESKSTHVTFITCREMCPSVHIIKVQLPQVEDVKYLGLHLDRRFSWHKHIFTKRKQLGVTFTKYTTYSDVSLNYLPTTESSFTRRYSNPSAPTAYNYGAPHLRLT
jgi:uncharacterized UPF0160 family protein